MVEFLRPRKGDDMSENRCQCGGLRHKHDIEKIAALESSLAQAQADVEALTTMVAAYNAARTDGDFVFPKLGFDELDDAYAALPEHLRGAKR